MARSVSTLKAIFLFSSTIIGAGILALPVAAAEAGFAPLAAMIVFVAVVSGFSGLYIAEAALSDEHPYLPTLARKYLGTWGFVAMLLGIAINIYGALVGYLAAGGQISALPTTPALQCHHAAG
jgi:amino acid permease